MNFLNKSDLLENIDWDLLKRFNIVVNSPSFIEAAHRIGTSNAAILKQMNYLEQQLDVNLFVRTAKQRIHELTIEGKILYSITKSFDDIIRKKIKTHIIKGNLLEERKLLRVITTPGLASTLLDSILSEFLEQNSELTLELSIQANPTKLKIGEVTVRDDFLSQKDLKTYPLITLEHSFFASNIYFERNGFPKNYNDFTNHKILAYKYFNINNIDQYTLNKENYLYLLPYIQSDYIEFLVKMALKDKGIIELPHIHPATKNLTRIESIPSNKTDIYVAFLDVASQEDVVYLFIEYLQKRKAND